MTSPKTSFREHDEIRVLTEDIKENNVVPLEQLPQIAE